MFSLSSLSIIEVLSSKLIGVAFKLLIFFFFFAFFPLEHSFGQNAANVPGFLTNCTVQKSLGN